MTASGSRTENYTRGTCVYWFDLEPNSPRNKQYVFWTQLFCFISISIRTYQITYKRQSLFFPSVSLWLLKQSRDQTLNIGIVSPLTRTRFVSRKWVQPQMSIVRNWWLFWCMLRFFFFKRKFTVQYVRGRWFIMTMERTTSLFPWRNHWFRSFGVTHKYILLGGWGTWRDSWTLNIALFRYGFVCTIRKPFNKKKKINNKSTIL